MAVIDVEILLMLFGIVFGAAVVHGVSGFTNGTDYLTLVVQLQLCIFCQYPKIKRNIWVERKCYFFSVLMDVMLRMVNGMLSKTLVFYGISRLVS